MTELFHLAFSAPHLPYTMLLLLILLYWMTVIIGALDLDFLNIEVDTPDMDLDADIDMDLDTEVEVDTEVEAGQEVAAGGGAWLLKTLAFFNIGKVPFMVFLSMFVLALWVSSVLNYHYWGHAFKDFFAWWFLPNVLIGLFAARLLTAPFKGTFATMNQEGRSKRELVGKTGEVVMRIGAGKIGRLEVFDGEEHYSLDVKAAGNKVIEKGQQAIIVEYNPQKDMYLVEPF
ncbi:MAG: DUF1449 family protein [Bacteroidetes bacterium]|nr:MAG: DUF1449 family protein [Bacteroidota bacterium]